MGRDGKANVPWSEDEDNTVREFGHDLDELSLRLPLRSRESLKARCRKLGASNRKRGAQPNWTAEEDETLAIYYGEISYTALLGLLPGRTRESLKNRVKQLGYTADRRSVWLHPAMHRTPEERAESRRRAQEKYRGVSEDTGVPVLERWPYGETSWPYDIIDSTLPQGIPEQVRADIGQELAIGLLTGELTEDDIHDHVSSVRRTQDVDYRTISLFTPVGEAGELIDLIPAKYGDSYQQV